MKVYDENSLYAVYGQLMPRVAAQPDQGLCRLLTESMTTAVYVDEQRISRSDCTDAHAHLDRFYSHMV